MANINGYYLTEKWFSFMSENNQIVQCKHTAVYLYIVEMFNKRQWVKQIGLPTDFTIGALSISYKTYKGVLEDLVKFGFLKIEWSKNQYSSNQIELVKIPKAESKHIPKLIETKEQSEYQTELSIYKTYKLLNKKQINIILDYYDSLPSDLLTEKLDQLKPIKETDKIDFNIFWNLYGKKKGNKDSIKNKWDNLSKETQQKIINTLPEFKRTVSDIQFLPHPQTYLNDKRWTDELNTNIDLFSGETEEEKDLRIRRESFKKIKVH